MLGSPMDGARWIAVQDMHITIRFLGDIDRRTANDFADLIQEPLEGPFEVRLKGLGSFGGRQPRAIWAAVEPVAALERIAQTHERAARSCGLAPETRAFVPHVTLARLKGTRPEHVAKYLERNGRFEMPPFLVERLVIFSARPGTGGGPYVVEESFPLAGTSSAAEDWEEEPPQRPPGR
jgi:2'-5' RNA ligase